MSNEQQSKNGESQTTKRSLRRIDDFRLYYNHTIFPELKRMEYRRKRLLLLLGISALAMFAFVVVLLFFNAALLAFF